MRERLVRPEPAPQLEREDLDQAAVALGGGRRGDVEEAARAEERRARLPSCLRERPERLRARAATARRNASGERMRPVALVAAEDLVAAVADERDLDVAARRLADEQRRQRGLVAERLVEGPRDALDELRARLDLELLVLRCRSARRRRARSARSS